MAKKKEKAPPPDGPPQPEKPKVIQILSVKRTRKKIMIRWQQGDSIFNLDEPDNPLPEFNAAFDALPSVVGTICHLGSEYCEKGMRCVKMDVGEKGGTNTVALHVRKDIDDAAKEFSFKTPERLLAHPTEPGKYTPPLPPSDAALVEDMIEQAKQYVWGNRAQGVLGLEDEADEDEDGDGEGDEPKLPGIDEKAAAK